MSLAMEAESFDKTIDFGRCLFVGAGGLVCVEEASSAMITKFFTSDDFRKSEKYVSRRVVEPAMLLLLLTAWTDGSIVRELVIL